MNKFEGLIEEYQSRSEKEILDFLSKYWNITPNEYGVFTMIGTYKKADHRDKNGNEFAYFEDIRNTDGDILYYPIRKFGKVKLWTACNDKLEKQDVWRISVKLAPKKYRDKNPFSLIIADTKFGLPSMNLKDRLAREAQIRKIFIDTGYTERDAKNTVHALHNIMDDLYSNADDRFIYELLQNADDQPEKGKTVSVSLQLLKNHILFMHDGRVFDTDDVDSICSIGDSTKRKDKEKIGYKGIGFKSVFSGSDTVIINSGNYSFAFDKYSPIYGDENTDNIPWQLKPIWQEKYRYPKEIRDNDSFWKERVGISLEVEENDLTEYRMSIAKIFSHPIFLLFLKNIDKIAFNEGELHTNISKSKDGEILHIKRDGETDSSWLIKDYVITIPPEIKEALQDDRNVPEKLKESTLTQISFAAKVENGKISKINNSVLYAYLPTSVNDFDFPFIVNADFLLAANREQLHVKKIWNQFLFREIGKLIVTWVASLSKVIPSYLELLPIDQLPEEETGALSLSSFFNKSFIEALDNTAFILGEGDELVKKDEIIIDKTDLSKIIGADIFCRFLGTEKCLPSEKIDNEILEGDIFEGIDILKFDDVIVPITNNPDFNNWYISASEETKNELFGWIDDHNVSTSSRKKKLQTFVSNLPLFQFGKEYKSCEEISSSDYIVTTEHIIPIKKVLSKLGFVCSDNLFDENHPLYEFVELQDEDDLFNSIKDCDFSELTADERRTLFFSLADFDGVGEAKLKKEIAIFKNNNGIFRPLSEMVNYREDVPLWLYDYVLCKEDANTELAKYLIAQEDEFQSVIQHNINEIDTSWSNLYNSYKNEWTGQFTRQIIDNNDIDNDLLAIIEESDTETKKYFLKGIEKIELDSSTKYKKDSYEFRVLQLVLSVYDEPSDFSSKVYYDGRCIKDFTVSDDVICEYKQNGETKPVKMSLVKLLPQYKNQSAGIERVKNIFDKKTGLDKFFKAESKSLREIFEELNETLSLSDKHQGEWPEENENVQQYLFSVYYRKKHFVWYESYRTYNNYQKRYVTSQRKGETSIPDIDLTQKEQGFVNDIMDFLYNNNGISISIEESPFTCQLKRFFVGKCFDSDYVFEEERLLPNIEKWADDNKKKQYLIDNGVQTEKSNVIRFRKLFLGNKSIDFIDNMEDEELSSGLDFIATAQGFTRPFTGKNQKTVLLQLKGKKCCNLSDEWDVQKMEKESDEWNTKEYKEWIEEHYPHIYIYPGLLPSKLSYKEEILLNYEDADKNYYYNKDGRKLFVSNSQKIEDVLFEVVIEGKSDLNIEEYKFLCWGDDRISVSKDDIKEKDEQISSLKKDNQEKDELLKRYRAKYGELVDDIKDVISPTIVSVSKGDNSTMSKDKQYDAQIEAQKFLMDTMGNWSFPDGYGETDESGKPNHFSTIKVVDEDGNILPIVLKSYKKKTEPFKINTEEWDWIIQDGADLLIYDGKDIKRHDINDLVRNQANVSISFSTENLDIEERISAFSDSLHYFKELHFDFDSFNISKKAKSVKDIYNTNIGVQNNISDEDL